MVCGCRVSPRSFAPPSRSPVALTVSATFLIGNAWIGEAMSDEVVVLFTGAPRDGVDPAEYGAVSQQMTDIVSDMPGFISKE
jgi:hypothetical protein